MAGSGKYFLAAFFTTAYIFKTPYRAQGEMANRGEEGIAINLTQHPFFHSPDPGTIMINLKKSPALLSAAALITISLALSACKKPADAPLPEAAPPAMAPATAPDAHPAPASPSATDPNAPPAAPLTDPSTTPAVPPAGAPGTEAPATPSK